VTATVETHEDVAAIPDWDALMDSCAAPAFYSSAFLTAYRKADLLPADAHAYLVLRGEDGAARAALPATLMPQMDPFGCLSVYEPAVAARPRGLLSHAWHCYDTWMPTAGGDIAPPDAAALLAAFRSLAAEFAAPWYGLINVDATGPLSAALTALGAHGLPIDERYVLDLPPGYGLEDYLAALPGRDRYTLRAHRRRAEAAGAQVCILEPAVADLDAHADLVRLIGARHGSADPLPRGGFQDFLLRLGDAARVVEVRLGGELVGSGACLLDARRLHFWTCGLDYESAPSFSPFYVLFYETLRYAIELGMRRFECGRRNGGFKRRYGMRPIPLLAYLSPTRRPLVART